MCRSSLVGLLLLFVCVFITTSQENVQEPASIPMLETPIVVKSSVDKPPELQQPVNITVQQTPEVHTETPTKQNIPVDPAVQTSSLPSPSVQVHTQVVLFPQIQQIFEHNPVTDAINETATEAEAASDEAGVVTEDFRPEASQINPATPTISPQQLRMKQQTEHQQLLSRDSVNLDWSHVRSYSFNLRTTEDFIVMVKNDHQIKGIVNVYWEQQKTYIMSSFKLGEEVTLLVYEGHQMILSKIFYQAIGFQFKAKKGLQYMVRLDKRGNDKLILMHLQNYLSSDKLDDTLTEEEVFTHGQRTLKVQNKLNVHITQLQTFLNIVEHNAMLNDQISDGVLKQTEAYMSYQMVEILFVALATISQLYMIRRLVLNNTSVV